MTVSIVPLGVAAIEISPQEARFGRGKYSKLISPTQVAASSSRLSDGRIVITYESRGGVYARIIFADGKLSPEITVEKDVPSTCASVAIWNDGTFVVVYLGAFEFLFEGVYSRVFNPDGSPKSPTRTRVASGRLIIGRFDRLRVWSPTVATSQQQYKYAVAWSTGRSSNHRSGVTIRVIDALSGPTLADEYIIAPPTNYRSSKFNAAAQIVEIFPTLLAWVNRQEELELEQKQIHTQVHMPNGADLQQVPFLGDMPTIASLGPTGAPLELVANESIARFTYVMAARSDLNPPVDKIKSAILYAIMDVAVAYPTNGAAGHISSMGVAFVGTANELPRSAEAVSTYPAVVGLGGAHIDKFVLCWNDTFNICARVFNRQGLPLSNETVLVTSDRVNLLGGYAPSIAALSDGSFYVAWINLIQVANVAHDTIHGRRFELR